MEKKEGAQAAERDINDADIEAVENIEKTVRVLREKADGMWRMWETSASPTAKASAEAYEDAIAAIVWR